MSYGMNHDLLRVVNPLEILSRDKTPLGKLTVPKACIDSLRIAGARGASRADFDGFSISFGYAYDHPDGFMLHGAIPAELGAVEGFSFVPAKPAP